MTQHRAREKMAASGLKPAKQEAVLEAPGDTPFESIAIKRRRLKPGAVRDELLGQSFIDKATQMSRASVG